MLTATLTRPNAMSPPMSCDRKVYLTETIDIALQEPPKARSLTLEPVRKRSRAQNSTRTIVDGSEKSRHSTSTRRDDEESRQSDAAPTSSTIAEPQMPQSPLPSESDFSLGSRRSSGQQGSQHDSQPRESPTSTPTPSGNRSRLSLVDDKHITVLIEPQTGGCLQGDYIPVKINISHTKQVKSVYGVILTLFRQARVDMRPSIPLGPIEKGKEGKYEDYYPKSLTGLGGLSLSGAGASHVFRKDLYQSLSPLYIDQQNLAAEVNARVRVPEEAFPTISTVPGAMISFKYYVEVVVDIQGKLQGLEKAANNLAGQAAPTGHFINSEVSDMERSAFTPFGSTIIDTTSVRRDKGVVTFTFEIVIGTKDTERKKGKQKLLEVASEDVRLGREPHAQLPLAGMLDGHGNGSWYGHNGYHDHHWYQEHPYSYQPTDQYQPMYYDATYYEPPPPPPVPIPEAPEESQLTEKERIRLAETRLLPSQPPGMNDEHDDSTAGASAPFISEETPNGMGSNALALEPTSTLPEYRQVASHSEAQTPHADAIERQGGSPADLPPDQASTAESSSLRRAASNSDDKQELNRQHLQAEASAPPTDEQDESEPPSMVTHSQPSAPTLSDVSDLAQDLHDSHLEAEASPALPRYER